MLSVHAISSSQVCCNFCLWKISIIGWFLNGEVSRAREELAMIGDNGVYLSMTRVVRSCPWGQDLFASKLLCLIYCNPFAMYWLGAHLCSPWLTFSMNKSDVAKESCDCSLLMSLCGCIVVFQQLLHVSLEF